MAPRTQYPWQAAIFTIALHAAFIALIWLSSVWVFEHHESASKGEPVQASLSISAADVTRAQQAIRQAKLSAKINLPEPQTQPSPRPQDSNQVLQQTAQTWVDQPQDRNQEQITTTAVLASDKKTVQELKQKQAQVELTETIPKDSAVESRQRLKQQIEAVKQARSDAARIAQLEQQRLDHLAQMATHEPVIQASDTAAVAGQSGQDEGLRNRYKTALNATARSNWNTAQIPQQTRCQVEFTQIRGGQVIDVHFLNCALDSAGRDSVERALYKAPMPYNGFETVFQRKVSLLFCYPDEVCQ